MINVLHIEPLRYNAHARALLKTVAKVDYRHLHSEKELLDTLRQKKYQAVFLRLGLHFSAEMMQLSPHLRYLITPTTGLNHIDVQAAARNNIHILSLKGETEFLQKIRSTAEHTIALLLALIRHIPASTQAVKQGRWEREPFSGRELSGNTLGIIGYGRLGKLVARYAQAFFMKVLVYDTDAQQLRHLPKGIKACNLTELLSLSDFVSLHIPGSPENRNFMNIQKFNSMKTGAFFINTSRGEVVDEKALLKALKNGQLAGAALDVLAGDSSWNTNTPPAHPLISFAQKNNHLIITPHIGGYARESLDNTRMFMVKKFVETIKKPQHNK